MIITKNSGQIPDALLMAAGSTQSFFRVAAIQMASGPNVNATFHEAQCQREDASTIPSTVVIDIVPATAAP